MSYNIDAISANCYPGTTVLINKFDIQDETKLNEGESVLSSARNAGYEWLFADVDTDLLMVATIQASQGVTDLLRKILKESII